MFFYSTSNSDKTVLFVTIYQSWKKWKWDKNFVKERWQNIDSTHNVKRGQKTLSQKKSGRGRHFFQIYHMREGQKIFIFYLRWVKKFYLALRGGFTILSRHFEFDQHSTTGL